MQKWWMYEKFNVQLVKVKVENCTPDFFSGSSASLKKKLHEL